MPTYDCDDFRVSFERVDDSCASYSVVARAVDGRQVRSRFTMPMATAALEDAVIHLGSSRSGSSTTAPAEPASREVPPSPVQEQRASAVDLGGALAKALFDGDLGTFYDHARRVAATNGRGLRLTLSLASTPELLSVPWELLYRRPTFLASQRRTPVVRYLEVGDLPPPARIEGTVRILGVVASPTGLPELNVADERARVEKSLASMIARGLVQLDWCDPATPRSLRERLRDGSYHVLHYVGHSDFTAAGDGSLFLVDEEGGPAQVTDSVLTNLLGDQTSLRLTILNSCEGARTTLTDPFAGIATSLVALGVPAVVAMQFTISDRAAIVFAEELFTSLIGRQYAIDAAVSEARKAVFTEVNEIEWATPVLFLRSFDGQLFDFAAEPATLPLNVAPTPITVEDTTDAPSSRTSAPGASSAPDTSISGAVPIVAAASLPPPPPPPPPTEPRPPRERRTDDSGGGRRRNGAQNWIIIGAAAAVVIAVVVGVIALRSGSDDPSTDGSGTVEPYTGGVIEINPETGSPGTLIDIVGDPCPAPPEGTPYSGIVYWIDQDGSTIVSGEQDDVQTVWSDSMVMPDDAPIGAAYEIGAACYATDDNGDSSNFYEFTPIAFTME